VPKQSDVTTKYLLELAPKDWLSYAHLPVAEAEVLNANLETVIAEADKVIRVNATLPCIAHFELQASRDPGIAMRLLKYNVLLRDRFGIPVQSILILLRPTADCALITGSLTLVDENQEESIWFRYRVIRVWQQPVAEVLEGGLFALPLAPLSDLTGTSPEEVVKEMSRRINQEAPPSVADELWTTTYVLMGLRYNDAEARRVLRGIRSMQESVTIKQ
jgi:hypothetical protein